MKQGAAASESARLGCGMQVYAQRAAKARGPLSLEVGVSVNVEVSVRCGVVWCVRVDWYCSGGMLWRVGSVRWGGRVGRNEVREGEMRAKALSSGGECGVARGRRS